jgi:uncharacterized beta barrel domain-containing protein DUF5777
MIRVWGIALFLLCSAPAFAMPEFLQMYRSDPFRNPAVDGCNTCHMSPQGGDARNPFGQAFENAGETITPMLRAQFPDRFVYPSSRVGDNLTIHFSDPNKKQVVVETGGMKNVVDVDKVAVNDRAVTAPNAPAAASAAVTAPKNSEIHVDSYAHEGAFFGSNVVNLPDGNPQKKGGVDFFVGHRFSQDVKRAGVGGFLGFDSPATIAFGARVGLTDRLSVSVYRSNAFQTITLGTAFQVSRQSAETPITLQLRGGVDGKHNFGLYDRDVNPEPKQFSPYLQIVTTRTFKDRVSLTLVPTFAFNTRDEYLGQNDPSFNFGATHNNTIALGIGAGVRIFPTASLVGEYVPRLWGFRGTNSDQPGLSTDRPEVAIGLQKATLRHTFELLIAREFFLNPTQYAVQGVSAYRIGFNIYRKIR